MDAQTNPREGTIAIVNTEVWGTEIEDDTKGVDAIVFPAKCFQNPILAITQCRTFKHTTAIVGYDVGGRGKACVAQNGKSLSLDDKDHETKLFFEILPIMVDCTKRLVDVSAKSDKMKLAMQTLPRMMLDHLSGHMSNHNERSVEAGKGDYEKFFVESLGQGVVIPDADLLSHEWSLPSGIGLIIIMTAQKTSGSSLQSHLDIIFKLAARLSQSMQTAGVREAIVVISSDHRSASGMPSAVFRLQGLEVDLYAVLQSEPRGYLLVNLNEKPIVKFTVTETGKMSFISQPRLRHSLRSVRTLFKTSESEGSISKKYFDDLYMSLLIMRQHWERMGYDNAFPQRDISLHELSVTQNNSQRNMDRPTATSILGQNHEIETAASQPSRYSDQKGQPPRPTSPKRARAQSSAGVAELQPPNVGIEPLTTRTITIRSYDSLKEELQDHSEFKTPD